MAHLASTPLIFALSGAGWGGQSVTVGAAITIVLLASVVWYWRERRLTGLRNMIGRIYGLSEQILACTAATDMQRRLDAELGSILPGAGVTVYTLDLDGALTPFSGAAQRRPSPSGTPGPLQPPAFRCLADGEVVRGIEHGPQPHPVLCFPMFAQNDLTGVLQLAFEKSVPNLPREASEGLQHLANQVAITLKLLDQHLLREQVLRGEKLGAAGQLISGVAMELSVPLESIAERAASLLDKAPAGLQPELDALADETSRAAETLSRLVSFARGEQAKARPVDLDALLAGLSEFRAQQWRLRSISSAFTPSGDETIVVGAQGQLEQAFLSLLLHAEQLLESAQERRLQIAVRIRAGRALVEIIYSASFRPTGVTVQEEGAWGLDVCRGIFANHGGTLHHGEAPSGARFEVDLPLTHSGARPAATRPAPSAGPPLTILLAEPDSHLHRHLLTWLAARRHRVVPAANAADALDRIQRLRFDLFIASSSLPGLPWIELVERVRRHTPRILILADPLESGASFSDPSVTLLPHNCPEEQLDRFLAATPPAAPAS